MHARHLLDHGKSLSFRTNDQKNSIDIWLTQRTRKAKNKKTRANIPSNKNS